MLKKVLLASCLLVTAMTSQAALISYNGYQRDSTSNIVRADGLEWLKWDQTKGMSVNQALEKYAEQGWMLADFNQANTLFNAFKFGKTDWNYTGKNIDNQMVWDQSEVSAHNDFIKLFGFTMSYDTCNEQTIGMCFLENDPWLGTAAFFTGVNSSPRSVSVMQITDDATVRNTQLTFSTLNANAMIRQGDSMQSKTRGFRDNGVALVRVAAQPAAPVSAPVSLSLLALGLIALGLRRQKTLGSE